MSTQGDNGDIGDLADLTVFSNDSGVGNAPVINNTGGVVDNGAVANNTVAGGAPVKKENHKKKNATSKKEPKEPKEEIKVEETIVECMARNPGLTTLFVAFDTQKLTFEALFRKVVDLFDAANAACTPPVSSFGAFSSCAFGSSATLSGLTLIKPSASDKIASPQKEAVLPATEGTQCVKCPVVIKKMKCPNNCCADCCNTDGQKCSACTSFIKFRASKKAATAPVVRVHKPEKNSHQHNAGVNTSRNSGREKQVAVASEPLVQDFGIEEQEIDIQEKKLALMKKKAAAAAARK